VAVLSACSGQGGERGCAVPSAIEHLSRPAGEVAQQRPAPPRQPGTPGAPLPTRGLSACSRIPPALATGCSAVRQPFLLQSPPEGSPATASARHKPALTADCAQQTLSHCLFAYCNPNGNSNTGKAPGRR